MFEEEAKEYADEKCGTIETEEKKFCRLDWQKGAEFGYNKGEEELTERLDNATEIIELMKDLFFDCWQEQGLKAIKFEQRVNDFLKGE